MRAYLDVTDPGDLTSIATGLDDISDRLQRFALGLSVAADRAEGSNRPGRRDAEIRRMLASAAMYTDVARQLREQTTTTSPEAPADLDAAVAAAAARVGSWRQQPASPDAPTVITHDAEDGDAAALAAAGLPSPTTEGTA